MEKANIWDGLMRKRSRRSWIVILRECMVSVYGRSVEFDRLSLACKMGRAFFFLSSVYSLLGLLLGIMLIFILPVFGVNNVKPVQLCFGFSQIISIWLFFIKFTGK